LRHAEFLRGINRLLQSLFRINDADRFSIYYEELLEFEKLYTKAIDSNSKQLLVRSLTIQTLNKCFLEGDFATYEPKIKRLLSKLEDNIEYVDSNNQLVVFYKTAILYFGVGKYEESLTYLDRILNDKNDQLREDLKSFTYILYLIVLYDMRDFDQLKVMRKRAFVYLRQRNILGKFHHIILQFLKRTEDIMPLDLKGEMKDLRSSLEALKEDKFEAKPLLYFDIMSWLESKISNRPFRDVVKELAQG
jgi:tetratricopeptide (TPR) repeat protein